MMETWVGHITHFYNHLCVAVVSLSGEMHVNDILHILGHSTDFYQKAWSMEIDHAQVQSVGAGTEVALKVAGPVHQGDKVYLVSGLSPEEIDTLLEDQLHDWECGGERQT